MFLAVTQYTADVFLGEFGVDRDRIRVLGNAEAEAPEIKKRSYV